MKCPRCGLINPDNALWCDCGYDFASKVMRKLPEVAAADQTPKLWPKSLTSFCAGVFWVLLGSNERCYDQSIWYWAWVAGLTCLAFAFAAPRTAYVWPFTVNFGLVVGSTLVALMGWLKGAEIALWPVGLMFAMLVSVPGSVIGTLTGYVTRRVFDRLSDFAQRRREGLISQPTDEKRRGR